MIEILAVLIAFTLLAIEFLRPEKTNTEAVCKVWVQENQSSEWICVDRKK